ncbi:MAG: hypothetical protein U0235_21050 [Polyangiaceae bacterium]
MSCPYGQDKDGKGPGGAKSCVVPGTTDAITGNPGDADGPGGRSAVRGPYGGAGRGVSCCSCRCANVDGRTDDGANYCQCPDGFACEQLVTSIGPGDTGLTGAYCIKASTKYDRNSPGCDQTCDPATKKCN